MLIPKFFISSVEALLGQCVRLTMQWRLIFRRCILLFSMFHSSEDLDKLSSEQALMLLQVKLGNMVFPLANANLDQSSQIFQSREQLVRYVPPVVFITATALKYCYTNVHSNKIIFV